MNDWAEEGGTREKKIEEIVKTEKAIAEKEKEIEAIEARIKEIKKEIRGILAGGMGGLGILLIVVGAATSLPSVFVWAGSSLALASVLWIIQICRRAK